jgi:hypothetical protein
MTQTGVVAGGLLTDWVSLGALASSVPRDVVDGAIAEAGKGAKRARGELPPHVMVYFVMALALFADDGDPAGLGLLGQRPPGLSGRLGLPRRFLRLGQPRGHHRPRNTPRRRATRRRTRLPRRPPPRTRRSTRTHPDTRHRQQATLQ